MFVSSQQLPSLLNGSEQRALCGKEGPRGLAAPLPAPLLPGEGGKEGERSSEGRNFWVGEVQGCSLQDGWGARRGCPPAAGTKQVEMRSGPWMELGAEEGLGGAAPPVTSCRAAPQGAGVAP